MRSCLIVLSLILAAAPLLAADSGPCWAGAPTFTVNQMLDVRGIVAPGSEDGFQMVLTNPNSTWTGSLNGDTWALAYANEQFTGTGHAKLSDPLPFDTDIELRSALGSGNVVLRAADYNPLSVTMNVTGELWADMSGGTFVEIGSASLNATFSFSPAMIDWRWPLSDGDSWNYDMTVSVSGSFIAVVLGNTIEQPINETSMFSMAASVASGLQVNVAQTNGGGTMNHNYVSNCQWYGRKEMSNMQIGETITLNSIVWDVTGCQGIEPCAATPTPSPTPAGTGTPAPCQTDGVALDITSSPWMAGMMVHVTALVCNAGSEPLNGYPLFVLLEAYGSYWFGPSWGQSLDHYGSNWAPGLTSEVIIPPFPWPAGTGSGQAVFYGALLDPSMTQIHGDFDMEAVSWQ